MRNKLLLNKGYDIHKSGLFAAPKIRVIFGGKAHSLVWKALSILGIGRDMMEIVPADEQGRIRPGKLLLLDSNSLVILQSGNVTGGAFDPLDKICTLANRAGAWVHIGSIWDVVSSF